jgi:hypothetical protein
MRTRRPRNVNGSVYCYDISDVGRIFSTSFSYRKPGWVLHMLRHVVGDEAFFDILATYRAAFEFGSASTDDFWAIAEAVYGADLNWFSDPWIYDIGAPGYEYAWRQETVGGQHYVEFYVTQIQSADYPIFSMPIDVLAIRDGAETTHVVWNDEQAEHLLFAVDGPIDSLALDPDHWILTYPENAAETAFIEGPPKVVGVTPAPGSEAEPGDTPWVSVQFHKDVVADAAHVALCGATGGPVEFSLTYDDITWTATLTPSGPLPADDYSLTVRDGIVDVAAGLALDGEVCDPADPAALPSGDGLPGGEALIWFAIALGGDLDDDGDVDQSDLGVMLSDWGCMGDHCPGDVDGDGQTGLADLEILLANYGYGT